jgi:AraC family ethanolamine operon transcriptional activator
MRNRGWPNIENGLLFCRLSAANLQRLRDVIGQLFALASGGRDDDLAPEIAMGRQESLLAALDETFLSGEPVGVDRSFSYRNHMRIADTIDAIFHANPAVPIYSEALADEVGVSVRTLHSAVMRFRGVSLHQYLRMKRLWMVRQRLLTGDPSLQVKSCALAFGFWHLGEFAGAYAGLFGEVPSQTLARATAGVA